MELGREVASMRGAGRRWRAEQQTNKQTTKQNHKQTHNTGTMAAKSRQFPDIEEERPSHRDEFLN